MAFIINKIDKLEIYIEDRILYRNKLRKYKLNDILLNKRIKFSFCLNE